jgi:hypothetical protein
MVKKPVKTKALPKSLKTKKQALLQVVLFALKRVPR